MFNPKNKGFTLIELLIVLTIIGVMVTMVSLNVGVQPSPAKQSAHQIQQLLTLAREEAILKGQVLGWKLTPDAYLFYIAKKNQWLPLQDKILRSFPLHEALDYELYIDNVKVDYTKEMPPQILILPDGSLNNFNILMNIKNETEKYQVSVQMGKITAVLLKEN